MQQGDQGIVSLLESQTVRVGPISQSQTVRVAISQTTTLNTLYPLSQTTTINTLYPFLAISTTQSTATTLTALHDQASPSAEPYLLIYSFLSIVSFCIFVLISKTLRIQLMEGRYVDQDVDSEYYWDDEEFDSSQCNDLYPGHRVVRYSEPLPMYVESNSTPPQVSQVSGEYYIRDPPPVYIPTRSSSLNTQS